MLQEITFYLILGIPLVVYLGIITIITFLITGSLALLKRKGKIKISIGWHYRFAYISFILAFIHGILGFLAYF